MDFDWQNYFNQLLLHNEIQILTEVIDKTKSEVRDLEIKQKSLVKCIEADENSIKEKKTIGNMIFKRKQTKSDINVLLDDINRMTSDLDEVNKELEKKNTELEKKNTELEKKKFDLDALRKESNIDIVPDDKKLSTNISVTDGMITVAAGDGPLYYQDIEEETPIDTENDVIVHCTDLFPSGKEILCNYDGNKMYDFTFSYIPQKIVKCLSHRRTCHFTINNAVKPTNDGNSWNPTYVIIEPLKFHSDEFVTLSTSDSWTYGSVKLKKPILLVREDALDGMLQTISQEELEGFTIIKFSGDYRKCVLAILKQMGIKIHHTDANAAGHYNSEEKKTEYILDCRNAAINYVKNNQWDGKSYINFDKNELFSLYEVYRLQESFYFEGIETKIKELIPDVPFEFIKFIFYLGIKRVNDKYELESDDEVYAKIKEIDNRRDPMSREFFDCFIKNLDIEMIKDLYVKYLEYKNSDTQIINNDIDYNMSCKDLYKFENITYAKKVLEELEKKYGNIGFCLTEDGCLISIYLQNPKDDYDTILGLGFEIGNGGDIIIKAENVKDMFNKIDNIIKTISDINKSRSNQ